MTDEKRESMDVVKTMIQASFAKRSPTEAQVRADVQALAAGYDLDAADVEQVFNEICEVMNVHMDMGIAIEASEHKPWLADREPEWNLWKAYHGILAREGRGPQVLGTLDATLNKVLDHLGDPQDESAWARRALVIGEVQSGKTSTYIGLIDKAIDVGYRVIILLGGHTELLRRQTQERIDFGVVGRDSSRTNQKSKMGNVIGVGELTNTAFIDSLTTQVSDFRKASLEAHNIVPGPDKVVIFVTKKNKTVLEQIATWFKNAPHGTGNLPMLLIDDESDYASINVNDPEKDPTAINNAIRTLLGKFTRSSYVAFTATPFANIFIDDQNDEDLFPRDLIYALDSPTNYVGCSSFFGDESAIDPIQKIDDAADYFPLGHKRTLSVDGLPASLHEAIRTYLLTNAIRDLRGQHGTPTSMLVNVSRFVDVQKVVFDLVSGVVSSYRLAIDQHSIPYAKGEPNERLDHLKATFERQFSDTDLTWPDVLSELRRANFEVTTLITNAQTAKLDVMPLRHVSIGGDLLSRGLTLEGLSTSYFYRRTQAADTLMQMARWFGYRPGYDHLCRVWITEDMRLRFQHSLATLDDLRVDLKEMERQKLTPQQFGISVRLHPDALAITARNKMRAGARQKGSKAISLRGSVIESTRLSTNEAALRQNITKFERLLEAVAAIGTPTKPRGSKFVWQGVDKSVIAEFLTGFAVHPGWGQRLFEGNSLAEFVGSVNADDLQSWDLVVVGGDGDRTNGFQFDHLPDWNPPLRTFAGSVDEGWTVSGKRMRILGPRDVATTLSDGELDAAEAEARAGSDKQDQKSFADRVYTKHLKRPVLFVFPIQASSGVPNEVAQVPLIAVAVVVPGDRRKLDDEKVEYLFNTPAQRLWDPNFLDDMGEEDDESSDD